MYDPEAASLGHMFATVSGSGLIYRSALPSELVSLKPPHLARTATIKVPRELHLWTVSCGCYIIWQECLPGQTNHSTVGFSVGQFSVLIISGCSRESCDKQSLHTHCHTAWPRVPHSALFIPLLIIAASP